MAAAALIVPCSVGGQVPTLYVDGAELLQGVLVGGGQAGIGQRGVSISFSPAAAAAQIGAILAGNRGTAGREDLQRRFQTVLLVHLLIHKLMSLQREQKENRKNAEREDEINQTESNVMRKPQN